MKAGIALGSNIEPRLLNLRAALQRISEFHTGPEAILESKVYETSPVDCTPDSAAFLNAVVEISTDLEPEEIHRALQKIEQELGRPTLHERNSPRTIDLDLLYCDTHVVNTAVLTLPHPRMAERKFVLQPLSDIRPALFIPNLSNNISNVLKGLNSEEILTVFDISIR